MSPTLQEAITPLMPNSAKKLDAPLKSTVRDFMTRDPISVGESTTPRELARVLIEHAISGVPVVDAASRVVGVVSKTNLLEWCIRGGLGFGMANPLQSLAESEAGTRVNAIDLGIVADFMTVSPLLTAGPDESIAAVARSMREHHMHRVIVVDEAGHLIGVLTTFDLLGLIA